MSGDNNANIYRGMGYARIYVPNKKWHQTKPKKEREKEHKYIRENEKKKKKKKKREKEDRNHNKVFPIHMRNIFEVQPPRLVM
eukprot:CAMPEP_0201479552 /NCGR_PEP_ID=MMETSP0151_2-20130828/4240_1 /ASSEMBLY_ACC=CAM_ASM_000257 /TAXON_ID=200890 /ORGANISM="Paramoeba atlantica, Strain 621/1 / CCAP 1560/9" /LENGTH=82 /DNA_ID=CAMNT_0047861103 /DNA_START=883 /DNA_END=1131 /DNA_ORIENTATION=+